MKDWQKLDNIDKALYFYDDIQRALENDCDDCDNKRDPTAAAALSNIDDMITLHHGVTIYNARKWLNVVRAARKHFGNKKENAVIIGEYKERAGYEKVSMSANISKSEFYRMKRTIRYFVLCAACQEGIERVF